MHRITNLPPFEPIATVHGFEWATGPDVASIGFGHCGAWTRVRFPPLAVGETRGISHLRCPLCGAVAFGDDPTETE